MYFFWVAGYIFEVKLSLLTLGEPIKRSIFKIKLFGWRSCGYKLTTKPILLMYLNINPIIEGNSYNDEKCKIIKNNDRLKNELIVKNLL